MRRSRGRAELKPAIDREFWLARWKEYSRQKEEERRAGVEVDSDIARMRKWFQRCHDHKAKLEEIDTWFPDTPTVPGPGMCSRCYGVGWYFTQRARFPKRTAAGKTLVRETAGVVVCRCFKGQQKKKFIQSGRR